MIGWLHCTPDGQEGVSKSRAQMGEWPLPSCEPFNYIAGWFKSLRMSYSYQDIKAWSELTGWKPSPIEVDVLMAMSNFYRNALSKYRSKDYNNQPPFDGRDKQKIIDQTQMNLKAFFRAGKR